MTGEEFLSRLESVKPVRGGGWVARCPAHDDRNPSLNVSERDGKILLKCHAGCDVRSIVDVLGLTMSALFVDSPLNGNGADGLQEPLTIAELAASKKFPLEFLKQFGLKDTNRGVLIPYLLVDGSPAPRQRVRSHLAHVKGWCWWSRKDGAIVPYGLNCLDDARAAGYLVLVEGETDWWTLTYHGFPALGIPGAEMVKTLGPDYVQGITKVFILQEADAGGSAFIAGMSRRLEDIAWTGETRIVSLAPTKDANELHCADPAKFKSTFQSALDSAKSAGNPNGFTLRPLGEILAKPDTPVDYILEGCLVAGTMSGVFAKPKVGKGTLARNLCLAVSRGRDFLGLKSRQGLCIYLALEEREDDVKRDFRAMGADKTEPILIHAAPAPAEGIRALCGLVTKRKPRLIVIDPVVRLARIKDEKAYAEMYNELGPVIDAARETGTHVMLLHHSGKSVKADPTDSPLGTTAIAGIVATLIVLKRLETYRTIQTVQRIGEEMPETVLLFDPETKLLSIGGTREQAETETMCGEILEFLQAAVELKTESEITDAIEGKTTFARKALRQLVKQGKVSREGGGKRGDPFRYRFSFSCSHDTAGTREHETENPAETSINNERNLVPTLEQRSFPVPEKDQTDGTAFEGPETEEEQELPDVDPDWEFL